MNAYDDFFIRLVINMVAVFVLARVCYYGFSRHRAYASSFILFGMGVFLVTSQLHSVEISMGFAFGLFAIFSMLRYRTESITIKEMTYLFLVISMALLSAVASLPHLALAGLLAFICLLAYVTETSLLLPLMEEIPVQYEKIENIPPEREAELIADLRERTGLDVRRVEVLSVDLMRDSANLRVQYKPGADG
jgi:hypothetical protein